MTTITDPRHGLTLGAIDLISRDHASGPKFETLADDHDWGNPEPIDVGIKSLLQDGSIVVTQGHDNREINLRVTISGTSAKQLAEGEDLLFAEIGKRNVLTWLPPDGFSPTVFDVVNSRLEGRFDTDDEVRLRRTWALRLVALPFARSVEEASVTSFGFLPSPTVTLINNCSSATNWDGDPGAVLGAGSGQLYVEAAMPVGTTEVFSLELSVAPINFTTTPYLIVDWNLAGRIRGVSPRPYRAFADGVELTRIADGISAAGFRQSYYECTDTSVTKIKFLCTARAEGQGIHSLILDNLSRSDSPPGLGSAKQRYQTVEIAGSARAQASIEISDPTDSLGDCLVYTQSTADAVLQPSLRPWKGTSGTTTADVFCVSGARTAMAATDFVIDVPTQYLRESCYALMARTRTSAAGPATITWTAQAVIGSNAVGPILSGSALVSGGGSVWYVSTLGDLQLPTLAVPEGSSGLTRITLGTGHADMDIDEAWVFDMQNGALTWVGCGTEPATAPAPGAASNRIWIEAATLDHPAENVLIGNAADMSDAHYPTVMNSWGTHEIAPPAVSVYWMTTQAIDTEMTIRHYPRWHTHAVT